MSEPFPNQHPRLIDLADVPKPGMPMPGIVDGNLLTLAQETVPTLDENGLYFHNGYTVGTPSAVERTINNLTPLATDVASKQRVEDILRTGADEGSELGGASWVTRNAAAELAIRVKLAELSVTHPETYQTLRDAHVAGFHGTRSITLAGVLRTGKLMSADASNTHNERNTTQQVHVANVELNAGALKTAQNTVSFSHFGRLDKAGDYADTANDRTKSPQQVVHDLEARIQQYSEPDEYGDRTQRRKQAVIERTKRSLEIFKANPNGFEGTLMQHDFPVLVGVSGDFVEWAETNPDPEVRMTTRMGESSMGEFRPMATEIPVQALPVFAVPAARAEGMQKLLHQYGCESKVIAIESLDIKYPSLSN